MRQEVEGTVIEHVALGAIGVEPKAQLSDVIVKPDPASFNERR